MAHDELAYFPPWHRQTRGTDAVAHSTGCGPPSRQGALAAAAEGQEGSSSWAEVRYREAWAQQRQPSAWSSCYRRVLGRVLEADTAGPASVPTLPGAALPSPPLQPQDCSISLPHPPSPPFFLLFLLLSLFSLFSPGPSASSAFLTRPPPSCFFFLLLPLCLSQSSGERRD